MIKLFPEVHRQHVTKNHIVGIVLAICLVVIGFLSFMFFLFYSRNIYSRSMQFNLTVASALGIFLGLIILLVVNYSVRSKYQKTTEAVYDKKRAVTAAIAYRASLLEKFKHKNFDYHNASRRHIEQAISLIIIFSATLYFFDALYLWLILIIPLIIGYGAVWFVDRRRKNDYIKLSTEGISFSQRGESGFMPWDEIKEIECRRHKSGTDFLIKTSSFVLTFNKEIEPADVQTQSFYKRFLFNYKYARELVNQIRQIVPHAHFTDGI